MKKFLIPFLFLLGTISLSFLTLWLIGFTLFLSEGGNNPGAITDFPEWIFLFSLFLSLGKRKEVSAMAIKFFDYLEKYLS